MNAASIIKEKKTLSNEQWKEIGKMATISKIATQIADLLECSPELEIDNVFDFLHALAIRKIKNTEFTNAKTLVQGLEDTLNDWSNK